jgi:site-specific DNA-methyltransferase (adenine-specific)
MAGRGARVSWRVIEGDCIAVMAELDETSVDAVVTAPPYGIGFMGHEWDQPGVEATANGVVTKYGRGHHKQRVSASMVAGEYDQTRSGHQRFQDWCTAWATEALRLLKPGGHLLSFGGTRTYHRLACALEDAGFEIRDCLAWLYGSGFPKSLDVSKAIDKAAGAEREVVEMRGHSPSSGATFAPGEYQGLDTLPRTAPATPDAERWQGWGTALKPAFEPIVLARKPLSGTVAANVLEFGTGALNVDGTRIEGPKASGSGKPPLQFHGDNSRPFHENAQPREFDTSSGRWPANVVLDPEAAAMLDEQSGERGDKGGGFYVQPPQSKSYRDGRTVQGARDVGDSPFHYGDSGGASRFFYTAKTSRAERENGQPYFDGAGAGAGVGALRDGGRLGREVSNHHPTVKPVDLMQWLCRLVTPPGGLVLDPFLGSGSTGIAALREGFDFIGIEREPEYVAIARARIVGDAPLFAVGSEVQA